jgi:hydrogenase small subunit
MSSSQDSIYSSLLQRGVSRRRFLEFCTAMTATLAIPSSYAADIAKAFTEKKKPVVVWLEFQDCAGNSEAILRSPHPVVANIVLDLLSWEYHETIMAGAGEYAEKTLKRIMTEDKGQYIVMVEGAIPAADDGVYCTIGGRTALSIVREVCAGAAAVIAVGACAWDGGIVAAAPNPTGAIGLQQAVPDVNVVNLGGCPQNPANTVAVLTHFLTFGALPALDTYNRPLFAYGNIIHDMCERRAHYDAGRYVQSWGDEGHRKGWCLYKMGCKGPEATYNCPTVRFNDATSWPVKAGHGCIACASHRFWDTRSPFYSRLPSVPGFGVDVPVGKIGVAVVGAVAAASAVHGAVTAYRLHGPGAAARAAAEQAESKEPTEVAKVGKED